MVQWEVEVVWSVCSVPDAYARTNENQHKAGEDVGFGQTEQVG